MALRADSDFVIATQRFFLLTPPIFPLRESFTQIAWRCIPTTADGTGDCPSLATPNTRLAFRPPFNTPPGIPVVAPRAGEEDVAFTVAYSQAGGLGTTVVTVESGRVEVQDLLGGSTTIGAGQEHRVTSLAAGAVPLNLNGDTAPDLFRYNTASGEWAAEPGGGLPSSTGTWSPGVTVAPGDFDGNGLTDFLLYNAATGAGSTALNNGQGGFTEVPSAWSPGWRAYVMNLNGDRWSDLFLHQTSTGQWIQAIGQGNGTFQNYTGQWAAGWEPHPLDLNADDKADLLLFNASSGQWQWAVNNGSGGFTHPASGQKAGVTSVYPGDFSADGLWDVLMYDSRTGAWSLATNTGSGFSDQTGTAVAGAEVMVADLDADGDADALLYDRASGRWTVYTAETLADGSARLTAGATGAWAPNWRLSTTDFNTDGRADFLLYYPEGGMWAKAVNSGGDTFTLEEGAWPAGLTVLSGQSLTQGLLPNEAARASCVAEVDLRATGTAAARSIEFVNASPRPRQVHWLNGLGGRVLYRTLAPGERYVQLTPAAHPWVVTDGIGRCQTVVLASGIPTRAVLR